MHMTWRILVGDVREKLRELPDQSVQTCVTSPPYWGLRDYGTASWEGGDEDCDHIYRRMTQELKDINGSGPRLHDGARAGEIYGSYCGKCGATRIDSQIGLEPTPEAFVEALVSVFDEVWRVLKNDGTIWVNLGDSYLAQQGKGFNGQKRLDHANRNVKVPRPAGIKPKDLAGIPWSVAFALRARGWYLRSDIIWAKPNPMPESVTDRPTKAHEYLFLLSKSREYYYDQDAIAEPASVAMLQQMEEGYHGLGLKDYDGVGVQNPSSVKGRIIAGKRRRMRFSNKTSSARSLGRPSIGNESKPPHEQPFRGPDRNKRSVWTITTQPYPEAHFATFPEALVEPCILAGSRVGDLVLDPFCGSGTTGAVAIRLGRSFVGVELNPAYVALAEKRIGSAAPLFAVESPGVPIAVDPQVDSNTGKPDTRDLFSDS